MMFCKVEKWILAQYCSHLTAGLLGNNVLLQLPANAGEVGEIIILILDTEAWIGSQC